MRLASEDMSIRGSKCDPGAGRGWLCLKEPRRALRAFEALSSQASQNSHLENACLGWGECSTNRCWLAGWKELVQGGMAWGCTRDRRQPCGSKASGSAQRSCGGCRLTRGASITGFPFLFQVSSFLFQAASKTLPRSVCLPALCGPLLS